MNKETLEEAAREYWKRGQFGLEKAADTERAFLKGGKWQAERMYSEEEVLDLLYKRDLYLLNKDEEVELELPDNWIEQFKKEI